MLGKLLKYEIKATARIFIPLYAVLLIFAVVHQVVISLSGGKWAVPQVISMIVYVMILMGVMVMTLVVTIQRFYKNLLSDEGYLMFTLPASTWKHIVSKLLASSLWNLVSAIVAIMSILIVAYNEVIATGEIWSVLDAIESFFNTLGASAVLFTIEMLLACLISLFSSVLMIYAAIAIGHLSNRYRILVALGAYIALNTVSQILSMIAVAIPSAIPVKGFSVNITTLADFREAAPFIHFIAWYGIGIFTILSAGYFIVTNYILGRRLNLE